MRKIAKAGIRLENGIGKGKERNAAEIIIEIPEIEWAILLLAIGCLKVESLDDKRLNLMEAL